MPYIKLSDGKIIDITEKQKKELEKFLSESRKQFVSVNGQIIQTSKIIGIFSDSIEGNEGKKPEFLEKIKQQEEEMKKKSPLEKAKSELMRAKIYWILKVGGKEMPKEIEKKILKRLENFFLKNPGQVWVDKRVYLDLFPQTSSKPKEKGLQSLKEILPEKNLEPEIEKRDNLNFKKI